VTEEFLKTSAASFKPQRKKFSWWLTGYIFHGLA